LKLNDFRSLGVLIDQPVKKVVIQTTDAPTKPKKVHYDVQRQTIKDRILQLVKVTPVVEIVVTLKKEYEEVCKLEPNYVRMNICTIGMGTTKDGDWRPYYMPPETFTKA